MPVKPKKIQSRAWGLIIPHDAPQALEIISHAKTICKNYYLILHDQDFILDQETGEITEKNKHYHLLMRFANSRDFATICNYFAQFPFLKPNSFEKLINLHGCIRYLAHSDNPEKFQYDKKSIDTNDNLLLDYFVDKASSDSQIDLISEIFTTMQTTANLKTIIEVARPILQTMNAYQKFMVIRSISHDLRK